MGILSKIFAIILSLIMSVTGLPIFSSGGGSLNKSDTQAKQQEEYELETQAAAQVSFYVPECIYLNPLTGAFQFYTNDTELDSTTKIAQSTQGLMKAVVGSGSVTDIKVQAVLVSSSFSLSGLTIDGNTGTQFNMTAGQEMHITGGTVSGLPSGGYTLIKWIFSYKTNGITYYMLRYSAVYMPNTQQGKAYFSQQRYSDEWSKYAIASAGIRMKGLTYFDQTTSTMPTAKVESGTNATIWTDSRGHSYGFTYDHKYGFDCQSGDNFSFYVNGVNLDGGQDGLNTRRMGDFITGTLVIPKHLYSRMNTYADIPGFCMEVYHPENAGGLFVEGYNSFSMLAHNDFQYSVDWTKVSPYTDNGSLTRLFYYSGASSTAASTNVASGGNYYVVDNSDPSRNYFTDKAFTLEHPLNSVNILGTKDVNNLTYTNNVSTTKTRFYKREMSYCAIGGPDRAYAMAWVNINVKVVDKTAEIQKLNDEYLNKVYTSSPEYDMGYENLAYYCFAPSTSPIQINLNRGTGTGGSTSVSAYPNAYAVNVTPPASTEEGKYFRGYYYNDVKYFDKNGKCVRPIDLENGTTLTARYSEEQSGTPSDNSVDFYVPECIYLASGGTSFQYFVNNEYFVDRGEAETSLTSSTIGKIKAVKKDSSANVTDVKIAYINVVGGTLDAEPTTSDDRFFTNLPLNLDDVYEMKNNGNISGIASNDNAVLKWVFSYKVDGTAYKAIRFTDVYQPNTSEHRSQVHNHTNNDKTTDSEEALVLKGFTGTSDGGYSKIEYTGGGGSVSGSSQCEMLIPAHWSTRMSNFKSLPNFYLYAGIGDFVRGWDGIDRHGHVSGEYVKVYLNATAYSTSAPGGTEQTLTNYSDCTYSSPDTSVTPYSSSYSARAFGNDAIPSNGNYTAFRGYQVAKTSRAGTNYTTVWLFVRFTYVDKSVKTAILNSEFSKNYQEDDYTIESWEAYEDSLIELAKFCYSPNKKTTTVTEADLNTAADELVVRQADTAEFYVPECIYLASGGTAFTYFVNDTHIDSTTQLASSTSGYIQAVVGGDVTNVKLVSVTPIGKSATETSKLSLTSISVGGSTPADLTLNSGAYAVVGGLSGLTSNTNALLKWVFSYESNGVTHKVTKYTDVYQPNTAERRVQIHNHVYNDKRTTDSEEAVVIKGFTGSIAGDSNDSNYSYFAQTGSGSTLTGSRKCEMIIPAHWADRMSTFASIPNFSFKTGLGSGISYAGYSGDLLTRHSGTSGSVTLYNNATTYSTSAPGGTSVSLNSTSDMTYNSPTAGGLGAQSIPANGEYAAFRGYNWAYTSKGGYSLTYVWIFMLFTYDNRSSAITALDAELAKNLNEEDFSNGWQAYQNVIAEWAIYCHSPNRNAVPSTTLESAYNALLAANKYTISFNGNGSTSGSMSDMTDCERETDYTLTANTFVRDNYIFLGWSTDSTAATATYSDGDTVRNLGNTTLYAVWRGVSATVTFDKQDGTGGSSEANTIYGSAMPTITVPTKYGYNFQGYYTLQNGDGTKYYNNDGTSANNSTFTGTTILYAYWTAKDNIEVTFDKQEGTGGSNSVTATYDSAMPTVPSLPTKDGFDFLGYWSQPEGEGNQYYNENGVSVRNCDFEAATTLYANWGVGVAKYAVNIAIANGKFRIKFDNAGGEAAIEAYGTEYYPIGTKVEITAENSTGSKFLYWRDVKTNKVVSTEEYYSVELGENLYLEGVYASGSTGLITYYDPIGGDVIKVENYSEGMSNPSTEIAPKYKGMVCTGWSATPKNENMTINAVYASDRKNSYNIRFDSETAGKATMSIASTDKDGKAYFDSKVIVNTEQANFSHWVLIYNETRIVGGKAEVVTTEETVSYSRKYVFYAYCDVTVRAVFNSTEDAEPMLHFIAYTESRGTDMDTPRNASFTITRTVPSNYQYITSGILVTNSKGTRTDSEFYKYMMLENVDTSGGNLAQKKSSYKSVDGQYMLNITAKPGKIYYGRGYLTVYNISTGEYKVIYTDIIKLIVGSNVDTDGEIITNPDK